MVDCLLRCPRLKCDRALPACDSCIKRGDSPSCSYQSRRLGSQRHWPQSHGPPDNVQNRMDRLEGLILSMMSNGPAPGLSTATGDVASSSAQVVKAPHSQRRDQMADELETAGYTHEQAAPCPQGSSDDTKHSDVMKIDADYRKPFCVGEAHWAALLNEVPLNLSVNRFGRKLTHFRLQRYATICILNTSDTTSKQKGSPS